MCDSLWPHELQYARLPCLPEFAQTHVRWVSDIIQPSHPMSPLFLLPSIYPSIRVFSNELVLCIRWPKYWSFSFNISPSNEYSELISLGLTGLIFLQSKGLSRVFSSISSSVLSLLYGPTLTSTHDSWKNHSFDDMDLCQQKWRLCFLIWFQGLS